MTYIRYSQFEEDENGNPKTFNIRSTFSSHKSSRKKMNSIVIFSNISENGKGSAYLILVINANLPIGQRFTVAPPELNIPEVTHPNNPNLDDFQVHLN